MKISPPLVLFVVLLILKGTGAINLSWLWVLSPLWLPLAIVAVATHVSPVEAFNIAVFDPDRYAHIMEDAHVSISAFGGTFLLMVGLTYFFDSEKDVHWIAALEKKMVRTSVRGIEVGVALSLVLIFTYMLEGEEATTFLYSAVWGMVVFLAVVLIPLAAITTHGDADVRSDRNAGNDVRVRTDARDDRVHLTPPRRLCWSPAFLGCGDAVRYLKRPHSAGESFVAFHPPRGQPISMGLSEGTEKRQGWLRSL